MNTNTHKTENDDFLIKFINQTIKEAIIKNASDIHFEIYEKYLRIRLRQDGILYENTKLNTQISKRLIARIKIMAKLDISEQRLPQDGRFKIKLNQDHTVDIRVNTCPTTYGEKIVLRLLDNQNLFRDIYQLGFNDTQQQIFINAISKPQGLIIVTGPTGSGKTSTLYAALKYLNSTEKNISTVEDPVEINLDGINQVNTNNKIGLTFSHALRTILRQDPDIILIGEIRDLETAEIAIKAAQTGHLVLSTLHTNNSYEALIRLHHLGIAPYHIIRSITLITAQRLVRKLCPNCKQISKDQTFKSLGCKHCINGYKGRIAIHETLSINEEMLDTLIKENNLQYLFYTLKNNVTFNLKQSALEKVKLGQTTINEIYRVI